jgi:mono/diheme cytochrome c family protein
VRAALPGGIALAAATLFAAGCHSVPAKPADPGRAAYEANCLACHQADGKGVRGFQPPLVGSSWVKGDPQVLAAWVLTGGFNSAARKQSVNENVMPGFPQLDDETIASLLTYVRATFGDGAGPVTAAEVAAARAQVKTP